MTIWSKKPVVWRRGDTLYASVAFTWQVESVRCLASSHDGPYERMKDRLRRKRRKG